MNNDNLETEVKFWVADLEGIIGRITTQAATLTKPRVHEHNIRYDDAAGSLGAKFSVLRLRKDAAIRLTYKGVPKGVDLSASEARVREEIEFEVGDFDSADIFLQRLGFQPTQIYEKYRTTYQLGDVEIVVDEMPYGNFIELEGSESDIRDLAAQLDLEWSQRIVASYLALLTDFNAHFGTEIHDLTFENFADNQHSLQKILNR